MSRRSDAIGFFWEDVAAVREKKEKAPKREAPEPIWLSPDWLPDYNTAAAWQPKLLSLQEFLTLPAGTELLYDVECYPNFFCITFEDFKTGAKIYFELSPWSVLDTIYLDYVWRYHTKTGFNNKKYDDIMVELALKGLNNAALFNATKMLIERDPITGQAMRPYEVLKHYGIRKRIPADTIDLIEVAPLNASLKIYGARLHTPYMQDLPFPPGTVLTQHQAVIVRFYNQKDLIHTRYLRHALAPQLTLRYQMTKDYEEDLRSRSDAQIAEAVMRKELSRILGKKITQPEPLPGTWFHWYNPGFLNFQTPYMQGVLNMILNTRFYIDGNGSPSMPEQLANLEVKIGKGVYRMGIGGLHSSEKSRAVVSGGGYKIYDRDVTSYYPFLIINQGLFPEHIGQAFLNVFIGIVNSRVEAKKKAKDCKKAGDKQEETHWNMVAQSLKIVVNGAYGKLGSVYSCLYSPRLLIQTTITGQLSLLMLIEAMELAGIEVISANTDGVTMYVHENQEQLYKDIIAWWEKVTRFETEEVEYAAMYSRDVNNYIAVKAGTKLTTKCKGAYANPWSNNDEIEPWLHINPTAQIVVTAVCKLLTEGIPVEQTILGCDKMTEFICVRTVSSGCAVVTRGDFKNRTPSEKIALLEQQGGRQVELGRWVMPWDEDDYKAFGITKSMDEAYRSCILPKTVDYLGKAIRWYYAKGREQYELVAAKTGNRVGSTDGAMPCMELPTKIPADLDYDWYIAKAHNVLKEIGYE